MQQPTSIRTAPHYLWGERCDGWHLLHSPSLSVIQERMPPATAERRHVHRNARQFFFVLSGQLTLEVDGIRHTLQQHEGFEIAPGTPHQAFNLSGADTYFLVTSQPPAHGDRLEVPGSGGA